MIEPNIKLRSRLGLVSRESYYRYRESFDLLSGTVSGGTFLKNAAKCMFSEGYTKQQFAPNHVYGLMNWLDDGFLNLEIVKLIRASVSKRGRIYDPAQIIQLGGYFVLKQDIEATYKALLALKKENPAAFVSFVKSIMLDSQLPVEVLIKLREWKLIQLSSLVFHDVKLVVQDCVIPFTWELKEPFKKV